MRIRLLTRLGQPLGVATQVVHEALIPAFDRDPDVILWRDRTFKRYSVETRETGRITEYLEVFCYALPG